MATSDNSCSMTQEKDTEKHDVYSQERGTGRGGAVEGCYSDKLISGEA